MYPLLTAQYTTHSPAALVRKAAKGLLNHWSKVSTLLKIVGSRKFSKAHSSGRSFCSGVPVCDE